MVCVAVDDVRFSVKLSLFGTRRKIGYRTLFRTAVNVGVVVTSSNVCLGSKAVKF